MAETDPQDLVRELASALRYARWTGADVVDRAWARPLTVAPAASSPSTAPPPSAPVPQRTTSPVDAATTLARLQARVSGCEKCAHAQGRTHIVHGTGNPAARLMLVGDAPGSLEDAAGLPWQGEPGALLDRMLAAIGLSRADVWMTSIALCKAPSDGPIDRAVLATCSPYLRTQMDTIKPEVVLLLGPAVAPFLLKQDKPMRELRGKWATVLDRPTMATWPLADLLADPQKKREAWADLQAVQARLGLPKQRS